MTWSPTAARITWVPVPGFRQFVASMAADRGVVERSILL